MKCRWKREKKSNPSKPKENNDKRKEAKSERKTDVGSRMAQKLHSGTLSNIKLNLIKKKKKLKANEKKYKTVLLNCKTKQTKKKAYKNRTL